MLRVHFLNVGHGDCTVIKHSSGRLSVIDINNSQDYDAESYREYVTEKSIPGGISGLLGESLMKAGAKAELTDPIDFLKNTYPLETVWRFILTHPDLDHMRGIKRLHEEIGFNNLWDTAHTKPTPEFRSDADEEDWNYYQTLRRGHEGLTILNNHRGAQAFAYSHEQDGRAGGDGIQVLSPTPALVASCNANEKSNDLSYILRIVHAGRSIIFPGDAEEEAWTDLGSTYGTNLKSDFLRASHHGRDSGYHLETLQHISPRSIIVSVGRKPPTDATVKYKGQCAHVMSTRYYGNIELRIHDDGRHEWFAERNAGNP